MGAPGSNSNGAAQSAAHAVNDAVKRAASPRATLGASREAAGIPLAATAVNASESPPSSILSSRSLLFDNTTGCGARLLGHVPAALSNRLAVADGRSKDCSMGNLWEERILAGMRIGLFFLGSVMVLAPIASRADRKSTCLNSSH